MTISKRARVTDTTRAPSIRVAGQSLAALAEAGARGGALSDVEVRAVCQARCGQRVPTQFHSGV